MVNATLHCEDGEGERAATSVMPGGCCTNRRPDPCVRPPAALSADLNVTSEGRHQPGVSMTVTDGVCPGGVSTWPLRSSPRERWQPCADPVLAR